MLNHITRSWQRETADSFTLHDAAGHIVGAVAFDPVKGWGGTIVDRSAGGEVRWIDRLGHDLGRARRRVERELAAIRSGETERELIACRAASPMRPAFGTADVDGLALFDHARQPSLF